MDYVCVSYVFKANYLERNFYSHPVWNFFFLKALLIKLFDKIL